MIILCSLLCFISLFTNFVHCCHDQGEELFLIKAVDEDNPEVVKWLLNHKAKIDIGDKDGRTPLMHAVQQVSDSHMVDLLLQEKADVNVRDTEGKTALMLAAESGILDVLKALTDNGAETDIKDFKGRTLMHLAASNGHTPVLDMINSSSIYPDMINILDDFGRSPSWYAALGGHENSLHHLENSGASEEPDILVAAVNGGNLNIVKHLIAEGGNVSMTNDNGMSLLQIASGKGHADVVKYLLDLGEDIFVKDMDNKNLLHISSEAGYPEVLENLFLSGLKESINDKDDLGNTPVHYSAINDDLISLRFLMKNGGRSDIRNNKDNSPADEAAIKDNEEIVNYFLDEEIPIDQADSNGKTILHKATEAGAAFSVRLLNEAGANLNLTDKSGNEPIHYAINDIKTLKILLNASVDVDALGEGGKTPLQMAADSVNIRAVRCLLKYGAHPEKVKIESSPGDRYFVYVPGPHIPSKKDIKDLLWKVLYGEFKVSDLEC